MFFYRMTAPSHAVSQRTFLEISENKDLLVAPLALQMLIENAIKHNVVSEEDPLKIDIFREENHLVMRNDVKLKKNTKKGTGIGLENIKMRYKYLTEIPVNIYELGLIYTIDINDENEVRIKMSLTAPGCPVAGEMPGWVADAVEPIPGVKQVDVELVWEPPWGMDMMSDEARLELGFM